MIKKILISFLLLFLIFSCGKEENSSQNEGLLNINKGDFLVNIPSNWEIIKDTENILPKPNKGKIELVVASSTSKNGFRNNLLILSDDLSSFTTSKNFSMLNNVGASKDYIDYTLLSSKDFTFIDEEESILYVFEAKYNYDSPKLKFLQTSHICNQKKAYFLTIAIPPSIIDTSKYEYLLQSFKCSDILDNKE